MVSMYYVMIHILCIIQNVSCKYHSSKYDCIYIFFLELWNYVFCIRMLKSARLLWSSSRSSR